MDKTLNLFSSVPFGELEISDSTATILVVISIFIFVAVGISSFKLIQSVFVSDQGED